MDPKRVGDWSSSRLLMFRAKWASTSPSHWYHSTNHLEQWRPLHPVLDRLGDWLVRSLGHHQGGFSPPSPLPRLLVAATGESSCDSSALPPYPADIINSILTALRYLDYRHRQLLLPLLLLPRQHLPIPTSHPRQQPSQAKLTKSLYQISRFTRKPMVTM